ncbi:MAG: bifunctional hydroxymethylpyrimidine kinase/phosphomethylpyrimidine kinase, partial [Peptostreptococcaceae bacterium]|nr:bifunctional hydroxymethylpyrimidine kinase/phosphomethylpyrimidine kinase [Peptostreptococcaceae bacterium]
MEVTPEFLSKQLDSIFTDIYPDAVKIGMVSSAKLIETISEKLKFYNAKNIVVDPVMVSTSGSKFLQEDALETLKNCIFHQAVLLTPNIPEASVLSGISIINESDMIRAAEVISKKYECAVLCKGGHCINDANDLLYYDHNYSWFLGERIDNRNTHGTGCTLSSAITSGLAKGMDLETSIQLAKEYVSGALKAMLDLGKGNGPINHVWNIYKEEK